MFPVDLSDLERNHTVATFTSCLFDLGSSFWGPSIHVRFPRPALEAFLLMLISFSIIGT